MNLLVTGAALLHRFHVRPHAPRLGRPDAPRITVLDKLTYA